MEVGHVEELDHPSVPVAVGQFLQPGAVRPDDVRVAVVVLAAHEQEPRAVRGPLRREVERVAGLDVALVRAVRGGDVHLVVLVVAEMLAVRRGAVPVGEPAAGGGHVALVPPVEVHDEGPGHALDERGEAEPLPAGEEEQPAVVVADAVHRGHVRDLPGGEVEQARAELPPPLVHA
ncbi:MAG TPA: hypothetical protein VH092_06510, partial [Urbifossiella sp.]|nr:hypothetical protein [Urbifossiella sp.]